MLLVTEFREASKRQSVVTKFAGARSFPGGDRGAPKEESGEDWSFGTTRFDLLIPPALVLWLLERFRASVDSQM